MKRMDNGTPTKCGQGTKSYHCTNMRQNRLQTKLTRRGKEAHFTRTKGRVSQEGIIIRSIDASVSGAPTIGLNDTD